MTITATGITLNQPIPDDVFTPDGPTEFTIDAFVEGSRPDISLHVTGTVTETSRPHPNVTLACTCPGFERNNSRCTHINRVHAAIVTDLYPVPPVDETVEPLSLEENSNVTLNQPIPREILGTNDPGYTFGVDAGVPGSTEGVVLNVRGSLTGMGSRSPQHTNLMCTCPGYMRNQGCSHINAVVRAITNVVAPARRYQEGTPEETRRMWADLEGYSPAPARDLPAEHSQPGENGRLTGMHTLSGVGFNADREVTLRSRARTNRAGALTRFEADVPSPDPYGNGLRTTTHRVEGEAQVIYNGPRAGYRVETPTDSMGMPRLRCNCRQYVAYYRCDHTAVARVLLSRHVNTESRIGRAAVAAAQANAENRGASNILPEEAPPPVTARDGDMTTTYTDSLDGFTGAYQAARELMEAGSPALTYITENATGGVGARGTGRGFGVEIEFDFESGVDRSAALRQIGRELHEAGLTRDARQGYYHTSANRGYTDQHEGGWSFEQDCTVAGEIVSPIMYDERETWENLATVCGIVTRNGGVANERTGAHIHVSTGNYVGTNPYARLLSSLRGNQDILFRLAANPVRGLHRGRRWCHPNDMDPTLYQNLPTMRASSFGGHGSMVNFGAVRGEAHDHIEFRLWDGTLDPTVIQAHIMMTLGLVESAYCDTETEPCNDVVAVGVGYRIMLADNSDAGEASPENSVAFRALMDRIFHRDEDKAHLTGLFASSRWQDSLAYGVGDEYDDDEYDDDEY